MELFDAHRHDVSGPGSYGPDFLRQKTDAALSSMAVREVLAENELVRVAGVPIEVFPWLVGGTKDEEREFTVLLDAPRIGYVDGMTDRLRRIQERSSFEPVDRIETSLPPVLRMLASDHDGQLGKLVPTRGFHTAYDDIPAFYIKPRRHNAPRTYLGIVSTETQKDELFKTKLESAGIETCVILLAQCDKNHQRQALTHLNGREVEHARFIN